MSNRISKTMFTSLAALTISLATVGAIAPASADVYSGRNGSTPSPFATGMVRLGLSVSSPLVQDLNAYYSPANGSAKSCPPGITCHQTTDSIDYPAPGS